MSECLSPSSSFFTRVYTAVSAVPWGRVASYGEIARQLVLSVNTVKKHVLNICGKLNTQSRAQAIVKAQALQPFDSVRDLITDKVAGARTQVEMRKFLTRLRSQAIIEWKNAELKKVYEKQVNAAEPVGGGQ